MSNYIFLEPYEDELIYSQLARIKVKSGYMAYIYAASDFYMNPNCRPDIEFLNPLSDDLLNTMLQLKPMEDWIMYNTMFPIYANFLPEERYKKAYESLFFMNHEYRNQLAFPTNSRGKYLRHCHMCMEHDREQYGETYWHRIHQIKGLRICPKHFCNLIQSDINMSGNAAPSLTTAEEAFAETENISIIKNNISGVERDLAKYMQHVLEQVRFKNENFNIGEFLHNNLAGTKYLSVRGEQRKMALLFEKFRDYYGCLPNECETMDNIEQLHKIFNGYRFNFYEVCQLGLFIGIAPEELANTANGKSAKLQIQQFDAKVRTLHEQGIGFNKIAAMVGVSSRTVRSAMLGDELHKTHKKQYSVPCGVKKKDWNKLDLELLPKVKEAAKHIYGTGNDRPKRVTIFAISKELGVPDKAINNMPLCKAVIDSYYETQEQYWRREVQWAVEEVQRQGLELNWRRIRDLTNLSKENFESLGIEL